MIAVGAMDVERETEVDMKRPSVLATSRTNRVVLGWEIGGLSVMAAGLGVGGDVEQALGGIGVPSYVLDTTGIVRWINPAAEQLLGDVRGRHFTSVVAPEDSHRARESFSRKVLGTAPATERPVS